MMLLVLILGGVMLVVASIVDLRQHRIPNSITYTAMGLCLAAVGVGLLVGDGSRVLSATVGATVFALLLYLPHRVRPHSMGLGDVKLAVSLGFAIGWAQGGVIVTLLAVGWTLAASSIFGLLMAAVAAASRGERPRSGQAVPFGPALSLAASLVVVLSLV